MRKWPVDIDPTADLITPYPCQTCQNLFRSCKALARHKCEPGGGKPARVHGDVSPRNKRRNLTEAMAEYDRKEGDLIREIVADIREN